MAYDARPWKGPIECGAHAFCACGESENKPFCDGSHARKSTGKRPTICDVAEAKNYAICMCGASATKPFCDGSHKRLGDAGDTSGTTPADGVPPSP